MIARNRKRKYEVIEYSALAVLGLDRLKQEQVKNIRVSTNTSTKLKGAGAKARKLKIHTDLGIDHIKRRITIETENTGTETEIEAETEGIEETTDKGTNHSHSKNLDQTKFPCLYRMRLKCLLSLEKEGSGNDRVPLWATTDVIRIITMVNSGTLFRGFLA